MIEMYVLALANCMAKNPISQYGLLHREPSIKYVKLEGEGVQEGVTVYDRGGGPRECDVTLLKKFIHMKPKIESDV